MKAKTRKMLNLAKRTFVFVCVATILASCGGGGDDDGPSAQSNPYILARDFVNSLNDVDGSVFEDNYMVKDEWDTVRSGWDSEDWFVYYDHAHGEYVAASLQYIRSIVYWDYYQSNYNLAEEYRDILSDDEFYNGMIGDGYGDDYEVVDYSHTDWAGEDYFRGFDSGHLYDDGDETTDVSLMASEEQDRAFYEKAAAVSVAYSLDIKSSLSLVSLGQKVEKMLASSSNEELTPTDQAALMKDIQRVTGASLTEFTAAMDDQQKKDQLVLKIAEHIGTSAENLENRLLPELINIEL